MQKIINKRTIMTLSLSMLIGSAFAQNDNRGTLTIKTANFSHDKGQAVIRLFKKDDELFGEAFIQLAETIKNGKAVFRFENISFEDYAATVFHDENSNGVLDHKLGFPNEPMGFSNNWKFTFFSGMPNFQKLSFEFSRQESDHLISIN